MTRASIPASFNVKRLAAELEPDGEHEMEDFQLLSYWMSTHRPEFSREFNITEGRGIVDDASGAQVGVYQRTNDILQCPELSLRDWKLSRQTLTDPQSGARWDVPLGTPLEALAPPQRTPRQYRWNGVGASPGSNATADAFAGAAMTNGWRYAERWPILTGENRKTDAWLACKAIAVTPQGVVALFVHDKYTTPERAKDIEATAVDRLRERFAPEHDAHDTLRAVPMRTVSTGPWKERSVDTTHARLTNINEAEITKTVAEGHADHTVNAETQQYLWDLVLPLDGCGATAEHRERVLGEALSPGIEETGETMIKGRALGLRAVIASAHEDFKEAEALRKGPTPPAGTYAWAEATAAREADRLLGFSIVTLPKRPQNMVASAHGAQAGMSNS